MEETEKTCLRHWYVVRCYPGKELTLEEELRNKWPMETFVPIKKARRRDKHGRFIWTPICALSSYVFLYVSTGVYRELVKSEGKFRVMQRRVDGMWTPLIVPEKEMDSFIAFSKDVENKLVYLDLEQIKLKKGDRVRVLEGPFAGVEGEFVQIGGKHEKRVVIRIGGVVALATAAIPASMVEKIE